MDYTNYLRADQYFDQALSRIPNDVDLWFGRGMLYDYSGEHLKAVNAYLRVTTLERNNIGGHICLGSAYAAIGDYDSALTHYQRSKALAPDTDNAHLRLGRDFFFSGNPGRAIPEFRQVIAEEPGVVQSYFFLFAIYRNLHKVDEAIDIYTEIRQRFPDHPDVTGVLFEQFGASQDAIRDFQQVLASNPNDLDTRYSLARCLRDAQRWEDAVQQYRLLTEQDPDNSHAHSELAAVLYGLGRHEEAVAAAQKAIELDRYSEAYTTLADAMVMLGRTETAAKTLKRQQLLQQQAWVEYQRKYHGGTPRQ
jgi:tetratricopeptide (TPR) repeat protein